MSEQKVGLLDQIWSELREHNRVAKLETNETHAIQANDEGEPNADRRNVYEDTIEKLVRQATPEETAAVDPFAPTKFDFIRAYVDYADVIEAPPGAHEAVATQLLATAMNPHVHIQHGAIKIPFDLWLLLLSGSGLGKKPLF